MLSLGLTALLDKGWPLAAAWTTVRVERGPLLVFLLLLCSLVLLWNLLLRRAVARRTAALQLSEARLREAQRIARLGHWCRYPDTDESHWSAQTYRLLEYPPEQPPPSLAGLLERVHPQDRDRLAAVFRDQHRGETPMAVEFRIVLGNGAIRHLSVIRQLRYEQSSRRLLALGTIQDITQQKRTEEALYREKERAQVTLNAIGDAVITTDAQGRVEYLNPVAERYTGWQLTQARGLPLRRVYQVVQEHERQPIPDPVNLCLSHDRVIQVPNDCLLLGRDGQEYAIRDSVAPIRDRRGRILGVVVVFHDITRERLAHRQRDYQASHDRLTGLVNRQAFEERLDRVVNHAREGSGEHALCYMDLDRFKVVNDTCGHAAGDELLRQLGQLLKQVTRKRDTLARLGGDEFALLMEHCALSQAERTATTICEAVQQFRFHWENQSFRVGVSIGLLPIRAEAGDPQSLLRQADLACFRAKDAGRSRIHLYQPDIEPISGSPASHWAARIKLALVENRLRLHCQEAVSLQPGKPAKPRPFEVMLRLREGSQLIQPGAFLPAAERYQLMPRLDHWVVTSLLEQLTAAPPPADTLWLVNLSAQTLADPGLLDILDQALVRTSLPPTRLGFEISETVAIAQLATLTHLSAALKARGCRILLDNFGSGLASFGYLQTLAVDFLKLDPALSREVAVNATQRAIVKAIAEVARAMDIPSIATGVENRETLEALGDLGVDYAQGYFPGRPRSLAGALASADTEDALLLDVAERYP